MRFLHLAGPALVAAAVAQRAAGAVRRCSRGRQLAVRLLRPLFDAAWLDESPRRRSILIAAGVAWLAVVLATLSCHEFSRDEVRALSIAIAAPSLVELPELLRDEGHPVVWYALLRLLHGILGTKALPVASILVAAAAVAIFLARSPFPLGLRLLFVFSALPLYEYSVMARNYGVSMLIMFAYAAVYPRRRGWPLVLAGLIALLANTNVHSALLAGILALLWLCDEIGMGRPTAPRLRRLGLAAAVVLAGGVFAMKTVLPDERSVVTSAVHAGGAAARRPLFLTAAWLPTLAMKNALPRPEANRLGVPRNWLILSMTSLLVLGLMTRIPLALGLLAAVLAFGIWSALGYPHALRHQGLLLVFALVLYWLSVETARGDREPIGARFHTLALLVVLPSVLLWDVAVACRNIRRDLDRRLSSCQSLAAFLKGRPELRGAILVAEPDYLIEALPYYAPKQRVYITRESRFGSWTRFTTESRAVMSLGELMATVATLRETESATVLIALGFNRNVFRRQTSVSYSYNKVLRWTAEEWRRFARSTAPLARFRSAVGDENFDLYCVPPSAEPPVAGPAPRREAPARRIPLELQHNVPGVAAPPCIALEAAFDDVGDEFRR